MFQYHLTKPGFKENVQKKTKSITFFYPSDEIYESSPYLVVLPPGKFTIECWGASTFFEDYAAYVKGTIELTESKAFYIYLGTYLKTGKTQSSRHLFNGGGAGEFSGGGASDLRLQGGEWDNFTSLKSRIIVAAGAGQHDCDGVGGYGGELEGGNATAANNSGFGGTQTSGGKGYVYGSFGKGGAFFRPDVNGQRLDQTAGGGSGYYGGGTGAREHGCGAGGGSSFISGHEGCNAIHESSTETNIIHTGNNIHYSGIFFTDTKMIGGGKVMPLPSGTEGMGYLGDGVVRISSTNPIPYIYMRTCLRKNPIHYTILLIYIMIQKF